MKQKMTPDLIEQLNVKLNKAACDKNSKGLSEPAVNDLFEIMNQEMNNQSSNLENLKDGAVYLIGTTGSGKSTLLNYLLGNELKIFIDGGISKLVLADESKKASSIGTESGKSHTMFPIMCKSLDSDITYVDTAGDKDSRGIAQQIINSYFKYKLSETCTKFKIIITTNQSNITENRGSTFVSYLEALAEDSGELDFFKDSLSLIVTHAGRRMSKENLLKELISVRDNNQNLANGKKLLDSIIESKRIEPFYKPSEVANEGDLYSEPSIRSDLISLIENTQYTQDNASKIFKFTITDPQSKQIIQKIINKSDSSEEELADYIINSIKQEFLKQVKSEPDLSKFKLIARDKLIVKGKIKNTHLKYLSQEYKYIDIVQSYFFKKLEFFHNILGEEEYKITLSSINSKFEKLGIIKLIDRQSEVKYIQDFESKKPILALRGFDVKISDLNWNKINQILKSHEYNTEDQREKFISDVSNELSIKYLNYQNQDIIRIEIQALHKVIFDTDFDLQAAKEYYKTVDLSIISPFWEIQKNTEIILSGNNGKPHKENKAGDGISHNTNVGKHPKANENSKEADKKRSTAWKERKVQAYEYECSKYQGGADGSKGKPGSDGLPGNNGQNGSSFIGLSTKIMSKQTELKIISNVGNGGPGQDGGIGGPGQDGGDSGDADTNSDLNECKGYNTPFSRVVTERISLGGKGGKGGDGGNGGGGGNPGNPGKIELIDISLEHIKLEENDGALGANGSPGAQGLGGRQGRDIHEDCMYARYYHSRFKHYCTEYGLKNDNIRGSEPVLTSPAAKVDTKALPYATIINYEEFLTSFLKEQDISKNVAFSILDDFLSGKAFTPIETDLYGECNTINQNI